MSFWVLRYSVSNLATSAFAAYQDVVNDTSKTSTEGTLAAFTLKNVNKIKFFNK